MAWLQLRRALVCLALWTASAEAGAQDWPHYGGGLSGMRFADASELSRQNVSRLVPAWTFRTGDFTAGDGFFGRRSSFRATPIHFDGRLYVVSGFGRVYALAPDTGALLWRYDPQIDFSIEYSEMFTARGVAAWRAEDAEANLPCSARIFVGTLDARLIALDARSGEPCRRFGRRGEIDLSRNVPRYRRGEFGLTSPPLVIGDVVVVGSSIGDNGAATLEPGFVRAYDARSGRLLWRWNPIPQSRRDPNWESWRDGAARRGGGANAWTILSADEARGLVFVPTTSPSPDFYGGLRPGDNRAANSIVALDAATGRLVWQFQTVRHDLWDYDNASQASLVDLRIGGETIPALVLPTKLGHVFVLNRETGAPIFPVEERAVPRSDIPGEVTARTQVIPINPPPLHPNRAGDVRVWRPTPEHGAFCDGLLTGVRFEGTFTPPSLTGTLIYPGNGGGTNWGSAAIDPARQIAVMAVNRLPTIVQLIPRAEFDRRKQTEEGGALDRQFTAQRGAPYGMMRFNVWNPNTGYPCLEGPWGELVAVDLAAGQVLWRAPVGSYPAEGAFAQAHAWGSLVTGGPLATAGGLVFIASRSDRRLRAFDIETGEEVWAADTPAQAHATPMAYRVGATWHIALAVGGAQPNTDAPGDYLMAFRLGE